MKRFAILVLALGLIVGSVATADAKKKPRKPKRVERVVELAYSAPSPGISGVVGACMAVLGVDGTACVDTPLGPGEVFVRVAITDQTGQPTNFDLAQDSNPDNPGLEIFASGCGETAEPIVITPGIPLRVSVTAIGGPDCPGVATAGDITITLSNLP
jgi:hypothetical protein